MSGIVDLDVLLASLTARLVEGVFVFTTNPPVSLGSDVPVKMRFEEAEGTTVILLRDDAKRLDIPYEFPCRMITLEIHSSLEAVGFMAKIAGELARAGMGVNPVSGFYHDHLFVPDGREREALEILADIAENAQQSA